MNLQMSKDLKYKASYDYWKPYLYEKEEKKKIFTSMLSSEADTTARVSVEETFPHEASHKCNLCGKSFSSGKALGGHSRSHFQDSKKEFKTLFSDNSKEGTRVNSNDEKKNNICYVCKKNFPTNKALYGHMRSHPDRVCKGISPPSNLSHENNKEDQEDGFVAPKGYSSDLALSKSPFKITFTNSDYEAATTLMHLSANSPKNLCSGTIEKFETPKSFVEPSSMKKKKREFGESSSSGKEHAIKKIKFVFSGSLKLGNKSDIHMVKKGKGLLCESEEPKVKETQLSEDILVVGPSKSAGPKRLEIDLNEPYVMKD